MAGHRLLVVALASSLPTLGSAVAPAINAGLAAGTSHVCSLKQKNRSIVCWGWDEGGQVSQAPEGNYIDVVAGTRHGCALREDGSTVCWGANLHRVNDVPRERFKVLASGYWHVCGLKRLDSGAVCWGSNLHGQCEPPAGITFASISVGASHSCGVAADGTAHCWGKEPQAAPPAGKFLKTSSGEYHSCGIRAEDSSAVCWGLDHYGQSTVPNSKKGRPLHDIVAGGDHTCAIFKDTDRVECWGLAKDGQATPPDYAGFRSLVAGIYYTCGVKSDGAVECWGRNTEMQTAVPDRHRAEL
mmetsp:Transcript_57796/g.161281  ORF Transcript_57796/g.161281 Transcript_57796/m.161281 type:complete len:299 (-) Transcript_57796:98-994(-)